MANEAGNMVWRCLILVNSHMLCDSQAVHDLVSSVGFAAAHWDSWELPQLTAPGKCQRKLRIGPASVTSSLAQTAPSAVNWESSSRLGCLHGLLALDFGVPWRDYALRFVAHFH